VSSNADMTISTYSMDDPNPNKKYHLLSTWSTPGVQMSVAYAPESNLLYSGGTNGNIYSWNVKERELVSTLPAHSDILMRLIVLKRLNNIASVSLDKTVCLWDSYTNERILQLHGHQKGAFDITYSPDYRLLVSCGFEHDAYVWSPFVNSLVFRLKGHHASLVGARAVENSPELLTADTSGVIKLWDLRNLSCVQTFAANLSGNETKDNSKMCSFFHTRLPSRNSMQKEDDSRIYAASKQLFSFDQARVVHEATTDYSNVFWMGWNSSSCLFVTVSDRNVMIWDALMGSKTVV
jgi:WD40 repeat protein